MAEYWNELRSYADRIEAAVKSKDWAFAFRETFRLLKSTAVFLVELRKWETERPAEEDVLDTPEHVDGSFEARCL